jgi:hypothetical protein
VPGDIGEYSSVDEAEKGMAVAYALQASATSLMAPLTSRAFSMPSHEYLIAEAPQARNLAPTRFAAVIEPKTSLAIRIEEHDSKEVSRPEPETIPNAPVAEIATAAVTENVTAEEPKMQVAAAIASDALKTQPVTHASSKKKKIRAARNSKRKRPVASRRSRSRNKRTGRRRGVARVKRVRVASLRPREPKRYRFHANSLSESHHRHMRAASSS